MARMARMVKRAKTAKSVNWSEGPISQVLPDWAELGKNGKIDKLA